VSITIRRDDEISDVEGGWFRARWHYSFDSYFDPAYMQFGTLRVFNDDRLIPGAVWPMHPHRDIEGLTYVVEGSFGHRDDVGGDPGPLPAGSVQRMTLGSGARHSERNASETEPMRFIQMWILPRERGLTPGVEQKVFTAEDRTDTLLRAISGDGGEAVSVHQDAHVFISRLNGGVSVAHDLPTTRGGYLYVIDGDLVVNGERMGTGDAAQVIDVSRVEITASSLSELILVDVALDPR
jgi:quercetin 2,3-dioxygenase